MMRPMGPQVDQMWNRALFFAYAEARISFLTTAVDP